LEIQAEIAVGRRGENPILNVEKNNDSRKVTKVVIIHSFLQKEIIF
jgi:hypothetical protein